MRTLLLLVVVTVLIVGFRRAVTADGGRAHRACSVPATSLASGADDAAVWAWE